MNGDLRILICASLIFVMISSRDLAAGEVAIGVDTPMTPPSWALLERELLRANTRACQEFFARYFDERGYLKCVERWGGDDGPDDAIECLTGWPILHALGAPDMVLQLYKKAWEGHLRQYTAAKTKDVPFARDGMYYKEFPVTFDWVHNSEGLNVFGMLGLADSHDARFQERMKRFAGFYMNEDPGAPNYDPKHKIIRSLFNGSRGPLLRKATAIDWAGDPIEVEGRFHPRHGEHSYREMLEHFQDYTDIVGDHPQNMAATSLALNAYMLSHEKKYKEWVLEYVDAWRERAIANGGIIPTNVGLDGKIGSAAGGNWYGGVYGWGFSVVDPSTRKLVHRNTHDLGLAGFGNAFLLTGDDRYVDVWRKQIETINAQSKVVDGVTMYPHMYGDNGWYDYTPQKYAPGALDLYFWSMQRADLERLPKSGWIAYQEGKNPSYPEQALGASFAAIRQKVEGMRHDPTTPDTRLADDPLSYNPATVDALIQLMLGGLPPGNRGLVLHSRVRYFDPDARRAGLPPDVGALVETMSADLATLTLVNINQSKPRTVIVQGGAYGEHQCLDVTVGDRSIKVDQPFFTTRLAPGAGGRMVITMKRYANQPALAAPWDRALLSKTAAAQP